MLGERMFVRAVDTHVGIPPSPMRNMNTRGSAFSASQSWSS
jgi:hypothetical protein